MAFEPTYATEDDIKEFLGLAENAEVTDEEIRRAELDTDMEITSTRIKNIARRRKVDPEALSEEAQIYLMQAVAAQVKYRRLMSVENTSDFFDRDHYSSTSMGGMSTSGRLSRYSPEGLRYLRSAGLQKKVSTVGSGKRPLTQQELRELNFERW